MFRVGLKGNDENTALSHADENKMLLQLRYKLSGTLNNRIYASVNYVSIGSGSGLSPIRRKAITWTNAG